MKGGKWSRRRGAVFIELGERRRACARALPDARDARLRPGVEW